MSFWFFLACGIVAGIFFARAMKDQDSYRAHPSFSAAVFITFGIILTVIWKWLAILYLLLGSGAWIGKLLEKTSNQQSYPVEPVTNAQLDEHLAGDPDWEQQKLDDIEEQFRNYREDLITLDEYEHAVMESGINFQERAMRLDWIDEQRAKANYSAKCFAAASSAASRSSRPNPNNLRASYFARMVRPSRVLPTRPVDP